MKKILLCSFALLCAALLAAGEIEYKLVTKDEMPVYKCGEPAEFIFSAVQDGQPVKGKYTLRITNGGRDVLRTVKVDLAKSNPFKFTATLKEPGFILVRAMDEADRKPIMVTVRKRQDLLLAGAGFEPEKIKLGFGCPEDFMQFWENNRKLLADTKIELAPDPRTNADYKVWSVRIKSFGGHTLKGFLSVPTGKGPFPAFVGVPPAGPGCIGPVTQYAKEAITLIVNVHKYETAITWAEQAERHKKFQGNYTHEGAGSRDTYFYRAVYTGVDRAINYVASMPEWDKKHMVTAGFSQGGGSAIILAGLNKHITAMAASNPALCDHGGFRFGRHPGWPFLSREPNVEVFSPYFDAGSFAKFVTVPALVSCGFVDTTCYPASVYAAYNAIASKDKKMVCMPLMHHDYTREYVQEQTAFVRKHLGLK